MNTHVPECADLLDALRTLNPALDESDLNVLRAPASAYSSRVEPQVGDFVDLVDGTTRRFAYHWSDGLQTTCVPGRSGSFHLSGTGASFSGSLDDALPRNSLIDTGETRIGEFWMFRHSEQRAHNGIDVRMPCRLWRATTGALPVADATPEGYEANELCQLLSNAKQQGDVTRNRVAFDWWLAGAVGAGFLLLREPHHTNEDIAAAKSDLRNERDVVTLRVALVPGEEIR